MCVNNTTNETLIKNDMVLIRIGIEWIKKYMYYSLVTEDLEQLYNYIRITKVPERIKNNVKKRNEYRDLLMNELARLLE